MLVSLLGELMDHREVEMGAIGQVDRKLVMALFEHVMEGRAAPVLRRLALVGRTVFERIALVARPIAPAEAAALENRMQRVDEAKSARQLDAGCAAAFAEAAQDVVLRQAGQALADQPVDEFETGRIVHDGIMPERREQRKRV